MIPLSVIVTCFNEEKVIGDCLAGVRFAAEILVVDSFSTDATVDIARRYTDRVVQHPFVNHAAQKNWAIPQAKYPWVLIVDADERVTPELAEELPSLLSDPSHDGYWIRRRNYFLGKEIRHGSWRGDKVLRLFRRDAGRYEATHVHEGLELNGRPGQCRGVLNHYSYRSLDDFLRKAGRYSSWGALDAAERGVRGSGWRIAGHGFSRFLKSYFWQRGFLDGTEGLIIALMETSGTFLKYAKLWELQRHSASLQAHEPALAQAPNPPSRPQSLSPALASSPEDAHGERNWRSAAKS